MAPGVRLGWQDGGDASSGFKVNSPLEESLSFGNILTKLKSNDPHITEGKDVISL